MEPLENQWFCRGVSQTTKGERSCEKREHVIGDKPENVLGEFFPRLISEALVVLNERPQFVNISQYISVLVVRFAICWTSQLPPDLWLIRFNERISEGTVRDLNGLPVWDTEQRPCTKGPAVNGTKAIQKKTERKCLLYSENLFSFILFLKLYI